MPSQPGSGHQFPAIALVPIVALNLAQPTIAGALAQAVAMAVGLRDLIHRRKP